MAIPRPVYYSLLLYDGSFANDCAGTESATPFVPLNVGDYVEHRRDPFFAFSDTLRDDQAYRVAAVKHSFQEFPTHIGQYVEVVLEVTARPK